MSPPSGLVKSGARVSAFLKDEPSLNVSLVRPALKSSPQLRD